MTKEELIREINAISQQPPSDINTLSIDDLREVLDDLVFYNDLFN